MRRNIDDLLDQLLIEIEKGKSMEDYLKDNPEFAAELESLLKVALEVTELPKPEPRIEAINQTWLKIRRILTESQKTTQKFSLSRIFTFQPAFIRVAAIVLLVVLIGWSSIALSTRSVPGDLFYPVKIVREKVQYILTSDQEGKMHLHLIFSNKRTKELAQYYKRKNQLNRKLVSAMLNEALVALKHTQFESTEEVREFLNKIAKTNQNQRKVLEEISACCCYSEIDVINEAINICYERYHHIQKRLEPETHQYFTSYRYTWDSFCNF